MAVKYDVIFKDGQKLSKDAICFGGMAYGGWRGSFSQNTSLAESDPANQKMIQFHSGQHVHPIWFEEDYTKFRRDWPNAGVSGREKQAANKNYLTELKLLVDDLPVVQDVLSVHPLVGVVRAHLKDHPADKIITSLMLVRNLCNYSDMAFTYRTFRSRGYRPRFCAIMAHLLSSNVGALGRVDMTSISIGEYNWFNPNHFGKNSFLKMMGHDSETEFDFIQKPWRVQRGYRRDNFYRNASVGDYTPEDGGLLIYDERMIYAEGWDYDSNTPYGVRQEDPVNGYIALLKTRNIVDCFCVQQDEPICEDHKWNPVYGFNITRSLGSTQERAEAIDRFVTACESLCAENGITIR